MNKIAKKIILTFGCLVIGYVIYFIADETMNSHTVFTNRKEWKEYIHLFNESIVQDVDTLSASTYVGNKDIYMSFNYVPGLSFLDKHEQAIFRSKKDTVYFVTFWAFKELDHFPLDSIDFRFNRSLDHLKVGRGEVLSPYSKQPVSIRYGYEYKDITINVDNKSGNVKLINGKNYKGFLGDLNRVSFSNEKEEHDIFIDYEFKRPVLFLVANIDSALYLITINSEIKFDESILSIIDFK